MFQEELPASSRGPDQVWFSMIMVNDPNAALFGSLRPSRPHPLVAAIRRPFESLAPAAPRPVDEDREPALRPRGSRWIAAAIAAGLVALGFGLTETALEQLTAKDSVQVATTAPVRIGSTTLAALPASAAAAGSATSAATARAARVEPAIAVNVTRDSASSAGARASAGISAPSAARANLEAAPKTAPVKLVRSTTSVKKKALGRQRRATSLRALAGRKAP